MKINYYFLFTILSVIGFSSCSGENDDPIAKSEIDASDNYNLILPDLTTEVDNDWLAGSEFKIYDKRHDDLMKWLDETTDSQENLDEADFIVSIPEYARFTINDSPNKEEKVSEILFGGDKLSDCRIVAGWVKQENDKAVSPLEIKPSQFIRINQFETEISISDNGLNINYGTPRKYGDYYIGVYVVGKNNGHEARGMFYITVCEIHHIGNSMEGKPYSIAESDPGFSIENIEITPYGIFGGGTDLLSVPAEGGSVTLVLTPERRVWFGKIAGHIKYETSGDLSSISIPQINLDNYTINHSNGTISIKMSPNRNSEENRFTINLSQYPNADELPAAKCLYAIQVVQAPAGN